MKTNEITVLLVDDDDDLRHSLNLALRAAGCQVHDFNNGSDALSFLLKQTSVKGFVLVTDIVMSHLSGLELIRRAKERFCMLPTVAMTGYGNKEVVTELLRAGCNDFMDKPVSAQVIVETVRNVHKQEHKGE